MKIFWHVFLQKSLNAEDMDGPRIEIFDKNLVKKYHIPVSKWIDIAPKKFRNKNMKFNHAFQKLHHFKAVISDLHLLPTKVRVSDFDFSASSRQNYRIQTKTSDTPYKIYGLMFCKWFDGPFTKIQSVIYNTKLNIFLFYKLILRRKWKQLWVIYISVIYLFRYQNGYADSKWNGAKAWKTWRLWCNFFLSICNSTAASIYLYSIIFLPLMLIFCKFD